MSDSELAVVSVDSFPAPILIERAGPSTKKKFFEFFTVPIRNANTRVAYYRAIQQFLAWVERAADQLREAPLTQEIVRTGFALSLPHADPADRFLAATAKVLKLTLVTADQRLLGLGEIASLANR